MAEYLRDECLSNYSIRNSQQPTNIYCASLYYLMRLERPVSVYIRPSSGPASMIDIKTLLIREEKRREEKVNN
jgi:hypothetical protein